MSSSPAAERMLDLIKAAYDGGNYGHIGELLHDRELYGTAVPLQLTATGPGSRADIVDYVRTMIGQRTTPNGDTSAERLAQGVVTSVLHRLGAGHSVATGGVSMEQSPDSECPECFAIIAPGRLRAHEDWHDSKWPRSES